MSRYPRGHVALERALSKLGLATRTEARLAIVAGRVAVDGITRRDPLTPVVPERAHITIDGEAPPPVERTTIVLHKPRGVVTTRRDPQARKTVYDLIGDLGTHVVPVGRLDLATSGLLIMTNDTALADWLADPANAISRLYLVTVRGRITPADVDRLTSGISVDGECVRARSAVLRKASGRESHIVVELTEGKNREIRRMLAAIDRDVTRLRRVQFGGLALGDLAPGKWRLVGEDELARTFPYAPRRIARVTRAT